MIKHGGKRQILGTCSSSLTAWSLDTVKTLYEKSTEVYRAGHYGHLVQLPRYWVPILQPFVYRTSNKKWCICGLCVAKTVKNQNLSTLESLLVSVPAVVMGTHITATTLTLRTSNIYDNNKKDEKLRPLRPRNVPTYFVRYVGDMPPHEFAQGKNKITKNNCWVKFQCCCKLLLRRVQIISSIPVKRILLSPRDDPAVVSTEQKPKLLSSQVAQARNTQGTAFH